MDRFLASFDIGLLQMMLRSATPVLLAALGGLLTEHAGIMNIGMEGMMLLSAFFAVVGSYFFGSAAMGVLLAVAVGILVGLFFALFVVKFKSDEFIIGVALNIFASGLTIYLLSAVFHETAAFGNDRVIKIAQVHFTGLAGWIAAHTETAGALGVLLLSVLALLGFLLCGALRRKAFPVWIASHRLGLLLGASLGLLGLLCFGRGGLPLLLTATAGIVLALISGRRSGGGAFWAVTAGGSTLILPYAVLRLVGISLPHLLSLPKTEAFLARLPLAIVQTLDGFSVLVYVALLLVLVLWLFVYRTPMGLWIRAAGEHPESLRTAGQSPERMKWIASVLCGALCGLAGAYLSIADLHQFSRGMSASRGYVAFACVIFGSANPPLVLAAALLFGFLDALGLRMQEFVNPHLTKMAPYLITVLAMVLVVRLRAAARRRKAKNGPLGK